MLDARKFLDICQNNQVKEMLNVHRYLFFIPTVYWSFREGIHDAVDLQWKMERDNNLLYSLLRCSLSSHLYQSLAQ